VVSSTHLLNHREMSR